ncbi:DUF4625 domain-containing protein [Chryseobacterium salipaludis]|uniref:DUF4625 domain-containing protein n=1 Tax=Chryseobacterium TaxID=59732 RepID=UPI001FF5C0ED|nr:MULTISPECIES: DUF4625 domain-containing protein [Chryseobacterium]MCJ8497288.1 DUF4625 domain-containing protein [Chryseobacterium salipaludis]MCX3295695.1 DUF4625 domain-containing protein [Planobacterium sp. JC490]
MKKLLLASMAAFLTLTACRSDEQEQPDTEYPEIVMSPGSFPQQCSVIQIGEKLIFRATFTDNRELGSYSLDIHHNFDHHNHTTETTGCDSEPKKAPVNPLTFIKAYDIPSGLREYTATTEIDIPANADTGDYHFMIRVTDQEGWQTLKGLSVKIK